MVGIIEMDSDNTMFTTEDEGLSEHCATGIVHLRSHSIVILYVDLGGDMTRALV